MTVFASICDSPLSPDAELAKFLFLGLSFVGCGVTQPLVLVPKDIPHTSAPLLAPKNGKGFSYIA